jgi:hypothetical protein
VCLISFYTHRLAGWSESPLTRIADGFSTSLVRHHETSPVLLGLPGSGETTSIPLPRLTCPLRVGTSGAIPLRHGSQ